MMKMIGYFKFNLFIYILLLIQFGNATISESIEDDEDNYSWDLWGEDTEDNVDQDYSLDYDEIINLESVLRFLPFKPEYERVWIFSRIDKKYQSIFLLKSPSMTNTQETSFLVDSKKLEEYLSKEENQKVVQQMFIYLRNVTDNLKIDSIIAEAIYALPDKPNFSVVSNRDMLMLLYIDEFMPNTLDIFRLFLQKMLNELLKVEVPFENALASELVVKQLLDEMFLENGMRTPEIHPEVMELFTRTFNRIQQDIPDPDMSKKNEEDLRKLEGLLNALKDQVRDFVTGPDYYPTVNTVIQGILKDVALPILNVMPVEEMWKFVDIFLRHPESFQPFLALKEKNKMKNHEELSGMLHEMDNPYEMLADAFTLWKSEISGKSVSEIFDDSDDQSEFGDVHDKE